MLGSFQILDDGTPRPGPSGAPGFWRGLFRKSEIAVIAGSWDVAGLRGTGSFDWKMTDVFIPEHRVMYHAGAPLDNQWSRWPGLTYALPSVAWVGLGLRLPLPSRASRPRPRPVFLVAIRRFPSWCLSCCLSCCLFPAG